LELLTGRIILRPQELPLSDLTLNARQELTRLEAVLLIQSLLSINNIGVVTRGDRELIVRAVADIRMEAPELVLGSLQDQPPSGKVMMKSFQLEFLDSAAFQSQIAQFLSPFTSVIPFPNSNTVIVMDTIANLQRVEYILGQVDRPVSRETKFYEILHRSATELADQIRATMESASGVAAGGGSGTGGQQVVMVTPGQPVPGQPQGAGPNQVVVSGDATIAADELTNQLIIVTHPSQLPFFDNLIAKLDVPSDPPTRIEIFEMKHADAVELAGLLSQLVSGRSQSSQGSNRATPAQRGVTFPNVQPVTPGNQGAARQQNQQAVQEAVSNVLEAEGSQFSEFMTIIADERTNAIVVGGTNNDLGLISRVIDRLDTVLPQVRIDVIIAEVTLTDNLVRGLDAFNLDYNTDSGSFDGWATGSIGGLVLDYNDTVLNAIFDVARDQKNNVNLLSVPSIVTTHNKEGHVLVGQAVPIQTGTQNFGTSTGGQFTSFSYQDVALEVTVKPIIGPNNVIQLEIQTTSDDIAAGTVTIDGNEQPIFTRRTSESYITVEDGKLVVLSGLQRNSKSVFKARLPLLGYIPIIGELFSRTTNSSDKTELLVFIHPTIIRNPAEADFDARQQVRGLHPLDENADKIEEITGETIPGATRGSPVDKAFESMRK